MMEPAPALAVGARDAALCEADGTAAVVPFGRAVGRAQEVCPLVCHAVAVAARLGTARFPAHDLLELFAFVRPARFCVPTPRGLAAAMDLPIPTSLTDEAGTLVEATKALLDELRTLGGREKAEATTIAWPMARAGWTWGPAVLDALGAGELPHSRSLTNGLRVWMRLPEWNDRPPAPPAAEWPVEPVEARGRLARILGVAAEERPQQSDYASVAANAFRPRDRAGEPNLVIAEAGTGVGKTLGYLAPAGVWVEKNKAPVWISTYTRNLQRQIDQELDRLYPDPDDKARRVVVRKGRENYLCLLNLDEAVARLAVQGGRVGAEAVPLGLMARWARATRDGDMVGGDFPAWLAHLLGARWTVDMTDTRGECIYSACSHYRKCFVERSIRRARRAEMVVANHALVLIQAAMGGEDTLLPTRYVFDEGHHLFDAADSAFSAHLSGMETSDLRRWLLGGEARGRSRNRGLRARLDDLLADNPAAVEAMDALLMAARALPAMGWRQRLAAGTPTGETEAFLGFVRQQVYARDADAGSGYGLEAATRPPVPGLMDAAAKLDTALKALATPAIEIIAALANLLDLEADELETSARQRIESIRRSLERRAVLPVRHWRDMLESLGEETPPEYFDWFAVERESGRDIDIGLHRHWIDPTRPFAATVTEPAHGVLITSASLRDATGDDDADWAAARTRTGADHVQARLDEAAISSPFDYPGQTRVFVVGDVERNDRRQVAAAYRELFLAAGGGGLGLFTAIARLRDVAKTITADLEAAGLRLYAQHVDGMDTATLVDIFRAEENACLLGTDAVRDGVDVPGRSLRLIVFDRVPWPRPTLLHRARRDAFGGRAHDEMLTRLKLKQAFGRLVRRRDDHGVFVMLDRALPTRLTSAFPEGVEIVRIGLAEAVRRTREFLG